MIDLTNKYKTREGLEVEGLHVVDNGTSYVIGGTIKGAHILYSWLDDGSYLSSTISHKDDLIEVDE